MPFNHAMYATLEKYTEQLQQLRQIINSYIPHETRVFYVTTFSEFDNKNVDKSKRFKRIDGLLRSDRIEILNRALYGVIEDDLLNATSNKYGFLDVFPMSKSRESWNTDSQHMIPIWYETEMTMFLDLFCNSVFHNSF
jgi:hypothetical protein